MRFEVEVVTPLFLGGAEVRGKPELRAASIRGALRCGWCLSGMRWQWLGNCELPLVGICDL